MKHLPHVCALHGCTNIQDKVVGNVMGPFLQFPKNDEIHKNGVNF
uniref:Uncharacterized protein n=1 Tax=Anguilla anguilla TaxID=7936 RepID=A0A0E9W9P3_ANGAN